MEFAMAEMLLTRMCHDMAGPVSAVNNGIEFVTMESDPEVQQQCMDVLSLSASEGLAKLQVFRMCFGQLKEVRQAEVAECKEIFQRYFKHSKITLDWLENAGFDTTIPNTHRRILSGMIFVMAGMLPFGGRLSVMQDEDGIHVEGSHPRVKEERVLHDLLEGKEDAIPLSPGNVPDRFLIKAVAEAGGELSFFICDNGENKLLSLIAKC